MSTELRLILMAPAFASRHKRGALDHVGTALEKLRGGDEPISSMTILDKKIESLRMRYGA
jgi:hypothetical protein